MEAKKEVVNGTGTISEYKPKLCPLLLAAYIGAQYAPDEIVNLNCREERCQWWTEREMWVREAQETMEFSNCAIGFISIPKKL